MTVCRLVILGWLVSTVGCAAQRTTPASNSPAAPTTAPLNSDSVASLSLDEIQPAPQLRPPATAPSSGPSRPSLDAIDFYARGRASLLQNQRYTGVSLLEKAHQLDPQSTEVSYSLGRAYLSVGMPDKALGAFERAAAIEPNDLDVQAELGRLYFNRKDYARAIEHLRIARLTDEYRVDDVTAVVADYRLAVALQQDGYDRAALEVYETLIRRLQQPSPLMRANPEVAYLLSHPESLLNEVATLYEKQGQPELALRAFQYVAQRAPEDIGPQTSIVELLITLDRSEEALARAGRIVREFNASPESLALLRETYARLGRESQLVTELQSLHTARPDDRAVLLALVEALESSGRDDEAAKLLGNAIDRRQGDSELVARLARQYVSRQRMPEAAAMLVETAARFPDRAPEYDPVWAELLSAGQKHPLRIEQVRDITVEPEALSAKWYYVRQVARNWNRHARAREALDQSVQTTPAFAPAFRAAVTDIWSEPNVPEPARMERTQSLIDSARGQSRPELADEIEGIALIVRKQPDKAIAPLTRAAQANPTSPQTQLALAGAHRAAGSNARFEQLMWRLISDHPRFADAYSTLFRFYVDQAQMNGARKVLGAWLANLPDSVDARLLEATIQMRVAGQSSTAERMITELVESHADDGQVLGNARLFFAELDKLPVLISLLEVEVSARPWNLVAVAQLVDLYASLDRVADASRLLDETRQVVRDDPDRLYIVAHLYQRIDQEQMAEQTFLDVLAVDPAHAPAANDLGYSWADSGRELDRAEALVRRAVAQEPDNASFLDSLGWVMYKRGRFVEAKKHLEDAVAAGGAGGADPVVLDHLGDVLYRLNQSDDAVEHWQDSLTRAGTPAPDERDELKTLRLALNAKLAQARSGQTVSVAPVAENSAPPNQAKK